MAKAIVKCLYCGEQFDRNDPSNHFIKIGRRYAHQRCANEYNESLTQEQKDLNALIEYIKDLLKEDYNFMKVKKQIEDYHKKYDYSYSGMLRSLKWFYEVKNNSIDKANGGIGIIPFIYNEAYKYYYNIYLAQQKNKDIENYQTKITEITIQSPRMYVRPPHLFDLDEEDN